jgi:hypothetical protein
MAAQPRIAIVPAKSLTGYSIAQEDFAEAASQVFKQGAIVSLSAGYLQEAGADPALILGVASRDGQNGATAGAKRQSVYLAHPSTLFQGSLDNGAGTTTLAATDVGKMYGLAKHGATGKWYVDSTDVTNKRVVIWGFWRGAQDGLPAGVGDTLAQVYFQFDPTYFQGSRTS